MYVPLRVNRFAESVLLIVQYRYLKSCSGDFCPAESDPPHKIMRYWIITQSGWVFDFHLTESVRWKWFVLAVYQFRKGISAGPALKYFTWFIRAGGEPLRSLHKACSALLKAFVSKCVGSLAALLNEYVWLVGGLCKGSMEGFMIEMIGSMQVILRAL